MVDATSSTIAGITVMVPEVPRVRVATGLSRFHGEVILASILTGTAFPAAKYVLGFIDPFTFGFLRVGIASVFAAPIFLFHRSARIDVFLDRSVWSVGCLSALSISLLHLGVALTTASKTSLIISFNVVFVAIFSVGILKDRLTRSQIIAIGLSVVAIVLLTIGGDPLRLLRIEAVGDSLAFGSAAVSAYTVVQTKRLLVRFDYLNLGAAVLLIAALSLVVPQVIFGGPVALPSVGWGVLLWTAVVATLGTTLLWTSGLGHINATVASLLFAVQVFVAATLSIALLFESISAAFLIGAVLSLAAVRLAVKDA